MAGAISALFKLNLREFMFNTFRNSLLVTAICIFGLAAAPVASVAKKATEASISLVDGVAVAPNGDIYISQRDHNIVTRVDSKGLIHTIAGTGKSGFSGDGGPANKALLRMPAGLHFDKAGNLYIADRENHRVRKVDTNGNISTIAGNGTAGFSGDGGPATQASINLPSGVTSDSKGNLYISDRSNNRIRKVDTNGTISTYAGNGNEGYVGDNGPALKATLDKPFGITMDPKDNLIIADRGNNRIRKVTPNGIITTIGGDGGFYFIGDNGPAYRASVAGPTGVALDSKGNLFIADNYNNRVRVIDNLGMIRTFAGTGTQEYNGDSEVARETNLRKPFAIAIDQNDNLIVADRSHYRIRRIDPQGSKVETVAGDGVKMFGGDGGPATGARLNFPHGIVVDKNDNVIFADKAHFRIRKIAPDGIINTIAGNGIRGNIGDGGPALEASVYPTYLSQNKKGEIYFMSPSGFVSIVRKLKVDGTIELALSTSDREYQKGVSTGKHVGASSQSDIVAITQFSDILPDGKGNLIIADRINHQLRKFDASGKFTTIAGTGESGYYGDGGPATEAAFRDPRTLEMDKDGNIYVGDAANNVIRKIDKNGIITTVAGNTRFEDSGDGGPAIKAGIKSIDDIVISPSGEMHIVESGTHAVRKIAKDGTISTVVGRPGIQGYFGDGGPATKAMLKTPTCLAFDSKGNMYITDMGNNRIRKVDNKGIITTFAGSGHFGWANEGEEVQIYFQNFP